MDRLRVQEAREVDLQMADCLPHQGDGIVKSSSLSALSPHAEVENEHVRDHIFYLFFDFFFSSLRNLLETQRLNAWMLVLFALLSSRHR